MVLRDEIGRDDQVVPGLYSEHGGVFVACKIGHRLHGEVVGHDHAVKAEPVAQQSVYGRGERCRIICVKAGDDIVADEHGLRTGIDAGLEGQQVVLLKVTQRARIERLSGVCVRGAAVAGEMLEYHADTVALHLPDNGADIVARRFGILTERAGIDKARRIG